MKTRFETLKTWVKENPFPAIVIASASLKMLLAIVNSATAARNSRTWAKEVERRRMTSF